MKRFSIFAMVVILLGSLFSVSVSSANSLEVKNVGFVISTKLTIRDYPSRNANEVKSLKNGDYVLIVGPEYYNKNSDDYFYQVISRQSWEKGERNPEGYVLKQHIKEGLKQWVTLPTLTDILVRPGSDKAVGSRSTNNTMVILDETTTYNTNQKNYEYWWIVQMQDQYGGAGFIKKDLVSTPWTRPEDLEFYYSVFK